ncbi:magnesium-translocating P-type ATPase [Breznakiella homolactica]|uniref:Magnesium-transporting ATPase, P-type 1 n=1 Tax=Breznakiella homolactica TaxID=2798577 RepID=A0A7T7XPQ6_9SPIR|nr:magnesium-translocating P-type ATPase [Breznakiella homolactica]QQO10132.1 magnesium-translocating P-type ATPase [Breznakiella homolactica]
MIRKKTTKQNQTQEKIRRDAVKQRLMDASKKETPELMNDMGISFIGLTEDQAEKQREEYGDNKVSHEKRKPLFVKFVQSFIDPFTGILFILAGVSFVTDIVLPAAGEKNYMTVIIIMAMVLISGLLRFIQETRSGNAARRLSDMVKTTITVERQGEGKIEIPLEEAVVGDIVYLSAGDMVPADLRIVKAKDLFISQSALTGESDPVERISGTAPDAEYASLTDYPNLAFMGSNVISGAAVCIVIAAGNDTLFGSIAHTLEKTPVRTSFEKGINSVSWILIRFMLIMVPVVFFINGFHDGDWLEAFLFAISIAVGLTPEMLPMIITTCLAKGAVAMSKKKTIIKNLNSMQNFGAMDILCTDKTGTLTQDKVVLEYHMDVSGKEDIQVLRYAFLNSYYQTGLKNLIDLAIIERTHEEETEKNLPHISGLYEKVDEVPFDFNRRRMSVVVAGRDGNTFMITKGAVEEMLKVCSYVESGGTIEPITEKLKTEILSTVDGLNGDGLRVIALARKTDHAPVGTFSVADESDMVLMGYLAFLDPPKETAKDAIAALHEYGVDVKILTGDNDRVTRSVCRQVGIEVTSLLLGADIENMDDKALQKAVEKTNVFAKLSPDQKSRIVKLLRANGHTVGFMGDGINDAAAMKEADVGISVDTAVDIAKESAHVILLQKDLMVLENGIIEGRKTYANMIKYIKMTASSNFGNVFSVLCASTFLPFLPMAPIHLILLNLIYDISCTSIPWDNVDADFLKVPRNWDASSVGSFMLWLGPASSVFDITTYLLMYFIICPAMCGGLRYHEITDPDTRTYFISLFRSGWFVESMWTQTLVIHMIRTPKIPFIQSRASFPVVSVTFTGITVLTVIPFTSLGRAIGLAPLPGFYFPWLGLTVLLYMVLATILKNVYIRRYGSLL